MSAILSEKVGLLKEEMRKGLEEFFTDYAETILKRLIDRIHLPEISLIFDKQEEICKCVSLINTTVNSDLHERCMWWGSHKPEFPGSFYYHNFLHEGGS